MYGRNLTKKDLLWIVSRSDNYKRSIGLVIELIKAMNDYGYELTMCVSIFGDQQDVMFFHKTNLK